MFIGDFDNGLEVLIAALGANIAWIDSILRECSGGCWIGGQELVAVVVVCPRWVRAAREEAPGSSSA